MKRKIQASFTLEAVFIMPIVLFIIVFILYLSFYLHDICKIQGLTDLVRHKAALNFKREADVNTGKMNYDGINKGIFGRLLEGTETKETDVENHLYRMLSKGLFITRVTDVHVSKDTFHIAIRVEGTTRIPIKAIQQLFSSGRTLAVEAKAPYHNPAETVRMSEVILDTGEEIKGFDKLKESIGKLIP